MPFFRIEYPAYFCSKDNAERPANVLHVSGESSRDLHMAQIANAGGGDFTVTEMTAAEYRSAALAKF